MVAACRRPFGARWCWPISSRLSRLPLEAARDLDPEQTGQVTAAQLVQLLQRPGVPDRDGQHAERGPVSAGWLGAYQARHSHEHVTELQPHFPPR